jgi:hypothetical protein
MSVDKTTAHEALLILSGPQRTATAKWHLDLKTVIRRHAKSSDDDQSLICVPHEALSAI